MRAPRFAAAALVLSWVSACAGLSARVDRGALADVPNEELLLLFDAENDVYIAKDEADLATRTLQDARVGLKRARAYAEVIAQRRTSGAAIDTVQTLDLLGDWNGARIVMRESEVALRELEVATSDTLLWAARARYEREKAKLVKDKNPAAGKDLELKDFDEQVKTWEARAQEVKAALAEREAKVVEARAAYFELSRRLQQESGGAYGGPWADLLD